MRSRPRRPTRVRRATIAAVTVLAAALSGCASVVDGTPSAAVAPNATLKVIGDSGGSFDTTAKNTLSDVFAFWTRQYPSISGGAAFPPIRGGLYSIDGDAAIRTKRIPAAAAQEGCLKKDPSAAINNAFFCAIDDSVVWDRAPDHLLAQLAAKYGPLLVAITFAHEIGHAVQHRLGVFNQQGLTEIGVETQADCAAGAFVATVRDGRSPHFQASSAQLDTALTGFLQYRDPTPGLGAAALSHGNGFDRISAFADGLEKGPTACFAQNWFSRPFTERPFVTDQDYLSGGNESLGQVLDAGDPTQDKNAGGLQPNLNQFWQAVAQSMGKTWTPVKTAQAAKAPCAADSATASATGSATGSGADFAYCPDDNTTYYNQDFASAAYYSIPDKQIDPSTAAVKLVDNQPGDFALGTLFVVAWGMAVRHQLFNEDITSKAALLGATCYAGAYARAINVAQGSTDSQFVLSPPDMDEATFAMLNLVGRPGVFGSRGTSGLDRIQQFVKGYAGGRGAC
jgi:predicted metalloprotease